MSVCKSCNAPIRWVHTTNGKRMPIDADPRDDGNVVMAEHQSQPGADTVEVLSAEAARNLPARRARFMPHHATCPYANRWRKS